MSVFLLAWLQDVAMANFIELMKRVQSLGEVMDAEQKTELEKFEEEQMAFSLYGSEVRIPTSMCTTLVPATPSVATTFLFFCSSLANAVLNCSNCWYESFRRAMRFCRLGQAMHLYVYLLSCQCERVLSVIVVCDIMHCVSMKELAVTVEDHIQTIRFNRPAKRNAMSIAIFNGVVEALMEAARNDDIYLTVLTGSGDYYSSGNDLNNFDLTDTTLQELIQKSRQTLE